MRIDANELVERIQAGITARRHLGVPIAADGLAGELDLALRNLAELAAYADALPADADTQAIPAVRSAGQADPSPFAPPPSYYAGGVR